MKQAFLKLAGVKTDAQFYKLFPSEASFFKKHPDARSHIKRAQNGTDLNSNGIPDEYESMEDVQNTPQVAEANQKNSFGRAQIAPIQSLTPAGVTYYNPVTPSDIAKKQNQTFNPAKSPDMLSKMGGADGLLGAGVGVIQGFSMLEEGKKERNIARQFNEYSQVALRASGSRDVDANNKRRYNRPEDNVMTGEQFFPVNGVGTNVLAKNGIQIAANGLEMLPEEGFDYSNMGAMGSQMYNGLTGNQMSGGAKIGGSVGKLAGTAIGGPLGGMVGEIGGNIIGGALDSTGRDTKKFQESSQRNIDGMMMNNAFMNSQRMNSGYMENGGELSDLEESGELQTLWGGKTEQLSHNPFHGETVMFKGQSHDEEDAEGNSGIGIKYGGDSEPEFNKNNASAEVELNEAGYKRIDPKTGKETLQIFGAPPTGKFVSILGKEAKGRTFKSLVVEWGHQENKLNKKIEKLESTDEYEDIISQKTKEIKRNLNLGKLKEIAEKKEKASEIQNTLNQIADDNFLDVQALAMGKITKDKSKMNSLKKAMNGYTIPKAQHGLSIWKGNVGGKYKNTESSFTLDEWNKIAENTGFTGQGNKAFQKHLMGIPEARALILGRHEERYKSKKDRMYEYSEKSYNNNLLDDSFYDDKLGGGFESAGLKNIKVQKHEVAPNLAINEADQNAINNTKPAPDKSPTNSPIVEYKRNKYMDAFNQALPFLRPSNATPLDGNQLLGEMYGMSSNQEEPVQSQRMNWEGRTPYDISFQDQINEVTAAQRAAQKATMNSPEVQPDMAATAYNAKSKILGEQFRANQGFKEQIYSGNAASLASVQEKNLEINDRQYTRQALARSNTKAINQALLNSISSKYQQNKLENRTLGIQENLYNYRFDKSGRAFNMNGFYQPNVSQANYNYDKNGKATSKNVFDSNNRIIDIVPLEDDDLSPVAPAGATPEINPNIQNTKKRNGGYITNGSIVKSLK